MRHTQGEWKVKNILTYELSIVAEKEKTPDILIATLPKGEDNFEYQEQQANARLIASCPRMYEFVKEEASRGNKKALDLLHSIN